MVPPYGTPCDHKTKSAGAVCSSCTTTTSSSQCLPRCVPTLLLPDFSTSLPCCVEATLMRVAQSHRVPHRSHFHVLCGVHKRQHRVIPILCNVQCPLHPTKKPHTISPGLRQRWLDPNNGMGHPLLLFRAHPSMIWCVTGGGFLWGVDGLRHILNPLPALYDLVRHL